MYFQGDVDGVNPPATSQNVAEKFTEPFERIILSGGGHFPTREAPDRVSEHLMGFLGAR